MTINTTNLKSSCICRGVWRHHEGFVPLESVCIYTYIYIPRTQITPVLIGKGLVLGGLTFKNRAHLGSRSLVFLLKMIILGCFGGYHHFRKRPYIRMMSLFQGPSYKSVPYHYITTWNPCSRGFHHPPTPPLFGTPWCWCARSAQHLEGTTKGS